MAWIYESLKALSLDLMCIACYQQDSCAQCQSLTRFPAVEGVFVVGQQGQQLCIGQLDVELYRRAEPAQQRGHRCAAVRPANTSVWLASVSTKVRVVGSGCSGGFALQWRPGKGMAALASSRPMAMGMTKGALSGWPGVAGQLWLNVRA
jgi:hypothetical protein